MVEDGPSAVRTLIALGWHLLAAAGVAHVCSICMRYSVVWRRALTLPVLKPIQCIRPR